MKLRAAAQSARIRLARWLPPRRMGKLLVTAVITGILVCLSSILWIRYTADDFQYSAESAPNADVAIVFGAEIYDNGRPSPFLAARLDLGRELLEAGKVKAILVTGDNGRESHDEPTVMRNYLTGKGVPAAKIALDYAGFSTYESCARAYEIFGVRSAIAVTQDFSLPRTVALCRAVGIDAVGVGDDTQGHNNVYWKCWFRDQLAATKAVYSIVTKPEPTFLGEQETSVRDAMAATP
ncbi:SanA/YdcF family protein [Nocardia huaxiensis]|uniref:YdcF family protein n=1 Tax=Nocardia huaxiensis TaxID=2755382 RepID=A0A7D6ZMS1_9NOCA|nr:ElyC/SanA/YdcF family protein [Nocardia huaxiensis]QLY33420.1 YdcF family protein [Nocardia huaxiensis]UFS99665.1 YdcF family protein [Nocardia huaxiensis]